MRLTTPVASAVPTSTTAHAATIPTDTRSARKSAPHRMPKIGITKVTVIARAGPTTAIRLKNSLYATPVQATRDPSTAPQALSDTGPAGHATSANGASTSVASLMVPVARVSESTP